MQPKYGSGEARPLGDEDLEVVVGGLAAKTGYIMEEPEGTDPTVLVLDPGSDSLPGSGEQAE